MSVGGDAQDAPNGALKKGGYRQIIGIGLGRTLLSGSFALVSIAMQEILLKINRNDLTKMSRFGSRITFVNTLLSFVFQPYTGALMDRYGRKPFLVYGALLAGVLRGQVGLNPNAFFYSLYRVLIPIVYQPWFPAFRATLSDLLDRRSDEYTQTVQVIEWCASIMRLTSLWLMKNYLSAEWGAILAGIYGVLGSAILSVCVDETLQEEDKRPIQWKALSSPLAPVRFFSKSQDLTKLGILNIVTSIPYYNMTLSQYRRQKFGWNMKDMANQQIYVILFNLLSPVLVLRVLRLLKNRGAVVLEERISGLQSLFNIFNSDDRFAWVTTFLAAFQFGDTGFSRELAHCAKRCDCGEGEQEAARHEHRCNQ